MCAVNGIFLKAFYQILHVLRVFQSITAFPYFKTARNVRHITQYPNSGEDPLNVFEY